MLASGAPSSMPLSSISLQPGSDGNVFAMADLFNGVLRIFDIRRSTSGEMKQFYLNCALNLLCFFLCFVFMTINNKCLLNLIILTVPVVEVKKESSFHSLWSVMFSPVNAFLIAMAGTEGTRILDIRNINANNRYCYR